VAVAWNGWSSHPSRLVPIVRYDPSPSIASIDPRDDCAMDAQKPGDQSEAATVHERRSHEEVALADGERGQRVPKRSSREG